MPATLRKAPCGGYLMPILRILGGLLGATVVGLGVYSITQNGTSIETIVSNIYRMIFGLLIILAELRFKILLKWFSFLTFFAGLGAFYIFVGGLALDSAWYEVTIAIVMVCMGFIYLGSACACSEYAASEQEDRSAEVGNTPSAAASSSEHHDSGMAYKEMEDGEAHRTKKKLIDNPFGDSDADFSNSRGAYGASAHIDDPFANTARKQKAYS